MSITITSEQASWAIHGLEMRASEIDLLLAVLHPDSDIVQTLANEQTLCRRMASEIQAALEDAIDDDLETRTEIER